MVSATCLGDLGVLTCAPAVGCPSALLGPLGPTAQHQQGLLQLPVDSLHKCELSCTLHCSADEPCRARKAPHQLPAMLSACSQLQGHVPHDQAGYTAAGTAA